MAKTKTETASAPRISVIDRRLKNPFGQPSFDVPLKGEKRGWVVRAFVADAEHRNRHYDAVHRMGWTPLGQDDLDLTPQQIGCVVSPDGRIVSGRHGEEMLMAMPKSEYAKLERAKSDANLRRLKPAAVRSEVAQATATAHGSEAGDMTYNNFSQKEFIEPIDAA